MSRTVHVKVGGVDYHMPVSYAVSKEIADRVGDPLQMALETRRTGSVNFTIDQIVTIIEIGIRHSGFNKGEDALGDEMMEDGLAAFIGVAAEYIGALIGGGPEKQPPAVAVSAKKKR